nr:MAG TPA: hypothetical protein [Caudoviricetes sp.]
MSMKSACRCSPCRTKLRSQAMRNRQTFTPAGVVRSSGSATRRPMIATTLSIEIVLSNSGHPCSVCAGAVLFFITFLSRCFQHQGKPDVKVGRVSRLVVVPVAEPDLQAAALGKGPQRPGDNMMLFQSAGGSDIVPAAADVALFFCLDDAFGHLRLLPLLPVGSYHRIIHAHFSKAVKDPVDQIFHFSGGKGRAALRALDRAAVVVEDLHHMDEAIAPAQDLQCTRRDFQKIDFGTVLLQHIKIALFRGHAAGAPGVVGVGHDGEQRPHEPVLLGAAPLTFRLHGQGQAKGLPVGQIVQPLQELRFHKFRRAFHLHPPGGRVIDHRQAADYFSHVILRPSLSANWTPKYSAQFRQAMRFLSKKQRQWLKK